MKRRHSPGCSHPIASGFGLMEVLIALGAISIVSAAMLAFYSRVETRVKVASDVENLRTLASAIERTHGVLGSHKGLSASSTVEENLAPADFRRAATASLTNAWGGNISISPFNVRRFGDSYIAAFYGLPTKACAPFLSALAGDPSVLDVRVDDVSAKWDRGGELDVATLATACALGGDRLEVVFYNGMASGNSVGALPSPPLLPPKLPEELSSTTPMSPIAIAPAVPDAVLGTPGVAPEGSSIAPPPAAPVPPPAAVVEMPFPPSEVGTPSPPSTLSRCGPSESNATAATCPAGQWGIQHWRTRVVCPGAGIDPSGERAWANPEAWAAPVSVTALVGQDCHACPSNSRQLNSQWVARPAPCPAGSTGAATQRWEQSNWREVAYHCPAGTKAIPNAVIGGWSAWTDTGASLPIDTSGCAPPPPTKTCAVLVDSSSGTSDVRDAYWSVGYSINGTWDSCIISHRDSRDPSVCSSRMLSLDQWMLQAVVGDNYSTSGSESGWESSMGQFWGWDSYRYELRSGQDCN